MAGLDSIPIPQQIALKQALGQPLDSDDLLQKIAKISRALIGADGATFVLRDGELSWYAEEDAISPLWKGRKFPLSACISGWVMLNGQPAVIEDIYLDTRIPADAYRPTFVKSLAMVAVGNPAIAAIGTYWARQYAPSEEEVALIQALADLVATALQDAALLTELRMQVWL